MKKKQDLTKWKITQKMLRRPPPPRLKKWVDNDRRLNAVIDSYDDYDRLDYLKCDWNNDFELNILSVLI